MDDTRRRNPFRSEADAFRLLLIIGAAVVAITLAAVLGGPWVGVPAAVLLTAVGVRATYRWLREEIKSPEGDAGETSPEPATGVPDPQ